jgi:flagellar biosynthetic protein FliO
MRHNTSLSNRDKKKISLIFFSVFFILLTLNFSSVYAQNKTGNNNNSNTANSTENITAAPDANANNPGNVNNTGNTNIPGQGFVEEDFKPKVEEDSIAWMIIKTILVLALFVGGFYMFFKFVTQKAGLHISRQAAIQILSTVSVGTNKFVQIIDVAGKVFLIGVSDNNISLLTEIKDRVDIDRIRLMSSRSTPVQGNSFQDFISAQVGWVIDKINEKRNRGSKKIMMEEITDKEFDMSYLNKQKSRLKNLDGNGDE